MIKQELLQQLIAAREQARLIEDLPTAEKPATPDEAYATSDALAQHLGAAVVGWKIGASVRRSWERLGLSEPFGGRIFQGTVFTSPAQVNDIPGVLTIGAEFAFQLGRDADRPSPDFDRSTILNYIDSIIPVLELNYPHFTHPMAVGGLSLIADNGVNYGLVMGKPYADWQALSLGTLPVTVAVNGATQSTGQAEDIGFDPYEALIWLANDRIRRGDPLKAGQLVSAGDLVGPVEAGSGAEVSADFGVLGSVTVKLK